MSVGSPARTLNRLSVQFPILNGSAGPERSCAHLFIYWTVCEPKAAFSRTGAAGLSACKLAESGAFASPRAEGLLRWEPPWGCFGAESAQCGALSVNRAL